MTGEQFRQLREGLGLSQYELAKIFGMKLRGIVFLEEAPVVKRIYELAFATLIRQAMGEKM